MTKRVLIVTVHRLTECVPAGVLGDGEGAVSRGFPHVLVVTVVLRDDLLCSMIAVHTYDNSQINTWYKRAEEM